MHMKDGKPEFFEEHPDKPYGDALIISSQPQQLQDTSTGLNSTQFWIQKYSSIEPAILITVELHCDTQRTPWCE